MSFRAIDNVGNVEATQTISLRSDATAPVTAANIGTPLFIAADGTRFISPATPVTFTSTDAVSGVRRIEVAVDGGAFSSYTSALTFAEGSHTVSFRAIDNVGNVEATQTISLRSDATAPVTAANIGTPLFIAADGTRFISPATPVTFTSTDTASGVQRIEVVVDGGAFVAYTSALTFAEGSHTVSFRPSTMSATSKPPRRSACVLTPRRP